ncbi:MAG: hypothetical protein M3N16_04790 [Actinomycetota bacterium]|nr:hypothetical protein [Actinomycetota bacterium]
MGVIDDVSELLSKVLDRVHQFLVACLGARKPWVMANERRFERFGDVDQGVRQLLGFRALFSAAPLGDRRQPGETLGKAR